MACSWSERTGEVRNHQIRNMALQFTAFTQNDGAQLFRLYSSSVLQHAPTDTTGDHKGSGQLSWA